MDNLEKLDRERNIKVVRTNMLSGEGTISRKHQAPYLYTHLNLDKVVLHNFEMAASDT